MEFSKSIFILLSTSLYFTFPCIGLFDVILKRGPFLLLYDQASRFTGSAWTWREERKQYYLHQFAKNQPDLNFRDPKTRQTVEVRYFHATGKKDS